MVIFPNAKINLGLNIVEKRSDGFHNIETCFIPVNWCDIIEITEAKKTSFTSTGIDIPGDPTTNLSLKAYELLRKDYNLPPVSIHLHKNIPIGAGLGGGSSDAAFVIKALSEKYNLIFENEILKFYASFLGSDCSFFIDNVPSMAYEKGDVLHPINLDLTGKFIVLVYPDLHVDTKTAYSGVKAKKPEYNLEETLLKEPIEKWKDFVFNDFEAGVFAKFPQVAEVKKQFYSSGAIYSAMSGSGSTVFGIFNDEVAFDSFPTNYKIWSGKL